MRMQWQLLALSVATTLAACSVKPVTFTPGDGQNSEVSSDCSDPACAGAPSCQPVCGNGRVEAGEECDDGNSANGDACENNCTTPHCGNGAVDPGEQCDDGNVTDGDDCETNCTLPACGNGIIDVVEQCDDGAGIIGPGQRCNASCRVNVCGDGDQLIGVEECDDGNGVDGDACETNCTVPACGNGIRDSGEQCDTGTDSAMCDSDCTPPVCGDGHLNFQAGEQCDDGNTTNGDGCSSTCKPERCGNGIVDPGEQCDDGNTTNGDACENNCTLPRCGNGIKDVGEQCDDGNTTNGDACENNCTTPRCGNGILDSGEQCDDGNTSNGDGCDNSCAISVLTYIKASNTGTSDEFGFSVALSADGSTLAVGARGEFSAANGIGGNQTDNSAPNAGAVYVFTRSGTTWSQQAYIKASNTGVTDLFGFSVALSADGSTLAVGAAKESSAAIGIGGNQADNFAPSAGAVYVFTRSGTTWSQQAYIKASNTGTGDLFGFSVALSADGSTLVVGARLEASAAVGIGGNQADNSAANAGAVYVFTRSVTTWSQQAYVKASNTGTGDEFGWSVALSADGSILAVGARLESSAAIGIGGDQADNFASSAGAVYVFTRSGTTWSQQAYVKASNTGSGDEFGISVALSADGSTLAVGARLEDSAATGIGGNQSDDSASGAGAVYLFTRSGTTWNQQAYVKASNTGSGDEFGFSVALSADGSAVAVAARFEASAATGIGGDQANNSGPNAGAVYVFTRSATWSQQAYVKASNTTGGDEFGYSVALAIDGTLAVGGPGEDSAATGIGGNQADNSASAAGAVYVVQ